MKIYFEDGELRAHNQLIFKINAWVDASCGISACRDQLDNLNQYHPDYVVYTNSVLAMNNKYCWNDELKVPELYICAGKGGAFIRVDELTERELRKSHNLSNLYLAGEFQRFDVINDEDTELQERTVTTARPRKIKLRDLMCIYDYFVVFKANNRFNFYYSTDFVDKERTKLASKHIDLIADLLREPQYNVFMFVPKFIVRRKQWRF